MPKIEIDFADVPDQFVPTPPGQYSFSIQEAPEVTTSKAGNPMLIVTHVLETEGDFKGRTVKNYLVLKNETKIKRLAMSCGMKKADIEANGIDTEELIGKGGQFILRSETYKAEDGSDRESARIARYLCPEVDEVADAA